MRQKTVFPTNELSHIWVKQSQEKGKVSAGNFFFEGTKIFSYGYHFCIANFVKPNVVLFNTAKFSNTTAKQQHHVKCAIPENITVFYVPNVGHTKYSDSTEINHSANIEHYKLTINNLFFDAKRSTKRTAFLLMQANAYKNYAIDYCNEFSQDRTQFDAIISPDLSERIAEQEQRAKEAEQKEIEKRKAIQIEGLTYLPKWLSGNDVCNINLLDGCYLRLINDVVETSKGARVSLKAAKLLFDAIKLGRDIKGMDIDGYTVISLNGVLTIGCHKIERSEINRFATLQGWGTIELH